MPINTLDYLPEFGKARFEKMSQAIQNRCVFDINEFVSV